jgi:hypothetical protein
MRKIDLAALVFLGGMLAFVSCKKEGSDDQGSTTGTTSSTSTTSTTSTTGTTTGPITMKAITGVWKSTGDQLPSDERGTYSEMTFDVKADSSCTWTKKHKSNPSGTLVMKGRVILEPTAFKDESGNPIHNIWFSFTSINNMDMGGTFTGIYRITDSEMTVDLEAMRSGATYPQADKGFGSGMSGNRSVGKYTKN